MTNHELKLLRVFLSLGVSEASELIGKCRPRTWQRWERGDRSIPLDVSIEMQELAIKRLYELSKIASHIDFDSHDDIVRSDAVKQMIIGLDEIGLI